MPRTLLGADTYKDKDLAELFYIHKRRKGYTFDDCAKHLGVSKMTVQRYFKNPSVAPLSFLRDAQKKLDIPVGKMREFLV